MARQTWPGWCAVCEKSVVFRSYGPWHRDQLVCTGCRSIPRQRAIIAVLSMVRPGWRNERIWELAPAGPASRKLRRECPTYVGSQYWPDLPPGTVVRGYRSEDVERPTFDDGAFDVIVSSDVFEHVIDVDAAHAQIARVLADRGTHIWTAPQHRDIQVSRPRVERAEGDLEDLEPAEYHGDPVSRAGALVTFDWGGDLPERVEAASGMWTTTIRVESRAHGLLGEFLEVFVSRRGAPDSGVHDARNMIGASAIDREPRPRRATFPAVTPWRSWWVTERLREIRATIRQWRGRPRR